MKTRTALLDPPVWAPHFTDEKPETTGWDLLKVTQLLSGYLILKVCEPSGHDYENAEGLRPPPHPCMQSGHNQSASSWA